MTRKDPAFTHRFNLPILAESIFSCPSKKCFARISLKFFILAGFIIQLSACREPLEPIGILLELSGSSGETAQACRDGILLAYTEFNLNRKYRLIIRDIGLDPEKARLEVQDLLNQGVRVFVGGFSSAQARILREETEKYQAVYISPSASGTWFSHIKDGFYRTIPSTEYLAQTLVHLFEDEGILDNLVVIEDSDNAGFTLSYSQALEQEVLKKSKPFMRYTYSSAENPNFLKKSFELAQKTKPSVFFILANPFDSGFIIQALRQYFPKTPIYGSHWSMGPEINLSGGDMLEGFRVLASSLQNSSSHEENQFFEIYQNLYGKDPIPTAILGWEAIQVMDEMLSQAGSDPQIINTWLKEKKPLFNGVDGLFSMDEWGEVQRKLQLYEIRAKHFFSIGFADRKEIEE